MAQKLSLNICHLYPDLMDTYGDTGNVLTILQRCKWRGINTYITTNSLNQNLESGYIDVFFFGGGQDKIQEIVGKDLQKKKNIILKYVEDKSVLLSVCGGYQLLQKYFKTIEGKTIKGVGLFNAHTEGSSKRMIQNLLIKTDSNLHAEINLRYSAIKQPRNLTLNLIGFENHSGKTYLGKNTKPLGYVLKGSGNNGEDKTEGAVYKNAFGCYLHGSLLPKNPHFTDYLITKALERKYGKVKLKPLEDEFEWNAHHQSIRITRSQS